MGKREVTFILVGSLLGGEAADAVCKHGPYWIPDHAHMEVPESDAGAYRRAIRFDSSATSTAATGTLELLKRLGCTLPIVK
jgi:hypothetical protein